jgi:AbrB family looped-hinge helix DNA binding protein
MNRRLDMAPLSTTKLSSKGQVVIPEEVRKALGLETGAKFVVMGDGDVVILKRITAPDRSEFRTLAAKARAQARRAGVRPRDVARAIRRVRRRG